MTAPLLVDPAGRPISAAAYTDTAPDYEATSTSDRMGFWGLSGSGPNAVIAGGHTSLKYRARHLRRNNPLIAGGVDSLVANMVGTDISPAWDLDDEDQKQELEEKWQQSVYELDYYDACDFYGLQEQTAGAMIVDGESLARMVTMPRLSGLTVPLKVQLLEGDHLDVAYNDYAENGNEIRLGIEWDRQRGGRSAYHLWSDHPGESFLTAAGCQRTRVDARDVCHVFRPLRPGQQRGGSFLASLLTKLNDIDRYDDGEVVRKKTRAMFAGFFKATVPPPEGYSAAKPNPPKSGVLTPGTMWALPYGWDVEMADPADVAGTYESFMRVQLRMVARAMGITYEQLSGDLSDVNFSSLRAGLIEFRRQCEMIRVRTLVAQFTRPIVLRWLQVGVLAGSFRTLSLAQYLADPRRYQRINYIPDAWDYVNPVDDRIAEQMDIRNGLATREEKITLRSGNISQVDRANASRNLIVDKLGLVYDSDPRNTAKSGAIQKAEAAAIGKER